jgi:hypothetical protein
MARIVHQYVKTSILSLDIKDERAEVSGKNVFRPSVQQAE